VNNNSRAQENTGLESGKYRNFARLAADWFWELDADLRYLFHDGNPISVTNIPAEELVGLYRIDVLNARFHSSDALTEHHRCLQNRLPVDVIVPLLDDNCTRHIHIIAEPQFDEDANFTGPFERCA